MNSGGLRESLVSPGSDRKVNSSGSLNSSSARGRQHTRTPTNQPNPAGSQSPPSPAPRERLECLDAVRGLNVMLMIFVDNTGGFFPVGINHSPWDDITLADFVMPLFLFMVGVSMAFAFKKLGNRKATAKKVV
jgi:heparan-alpha-glucosaminide N-acetyltransferase